MLLCFAPTVRPKNFSANLRLTGIAPKPSLGTAGSYRAMTMITRQGVPL